MAMISTAQHDAWYCTEPPTPSGLGWTPETYTWMMYSFYAIKGKQPYLELLPSYPLTPYNPRRVYLDSPPYVAWNDPLSNTESYRVSYHRKSKYPCQFPDGCAKIFRRPNDLGWHYKEMHGAQDKKDRYPCDHRQCPRRRRPFSRKEQYHDHLRDFHKEDLGSAKGAKAMSRKKWLKAQRAWLAERHISTRWWRCHGCLKRVYLQESGWQCGSCQEYCATGRILARRAPGEPLHTLTWSDDCLTCNGYGFANDRLSQAWGPCYACNIPATPKYTFFYGSYGAIEPPSSGYQVTYAKF